MPTEKDNLRTVIDAARDLHQQGDTRKAIQSLESHPDILNSDAALALLAHMYYLSQNYNPARVSAEKALELNPHNRLALHTSGELAMKSFDLEAAEKYFSEIVHLGSRSHMPYARLADVYIADLKYDAAVQTLRKGLEKHSGNEGLLEKLVYSLTMAGRLQEAETIRHSQQDLLNPDDSDINRLISRIEKLDPEIIVEQISKLLSWKAYQKHSRLYDRLAYHLMALNRSDEAVPHLQRLIELQPRNDHARVRLAKALALSGNPMKAREILSRVSDYRSDLKVLMVELDILIAEDKTQEAIDLCVKLLRDNPRNKTLRNVLLTLKRKGVRPRT